jgi:hypothetical protein
MKALTGKLPSITVVSIVEVTELAVSKLFLSSTKVLFSDSEEATNIWRLMSISRKLSQQ